MYLRMFGAVASFAIVLMAGCLLILCEANRLSRHNAGQSDDRANAVCEDGRNCAKRGVSAEANPYVGNGDLGAAWLHGWIVGRDELKWKQESAR